MSDRQHGRPTPWDRPQRNSAQALPTVEEQLDQVLALIRGVLEPEIVGAYLHGSAVLGGLRHRSDIDVLVLSRRRTTHDEKRRLVDGLLTVSGSEPPGAPRPIELTIVVESEIRPWRYPPRMDFQYGEWLRTEFESGNLEPWPATTNPDLVTLITMVLRGNRPLLGPPPDEAFEPIPHADYVRAIVDGLDGLLDNLDTDTRNVLLTLARIWSTLATGDIRAKDAAADWALARLPQQHRAVLAHARAIYLGDEAGWDDDLKPRVRPHAEYVVGEIQRSLAPSRTVRQAPAAMVPEARLESNEHGLVPHGDGWFVLNAREARWLHAPGRTAICEFEGYLEGELDFAQLGINLSVLEPGQSMGMYHWEADQEDFLVLAGEALLIVEGEERPLRQWDFVHCPAETKHIIVGAGDAPCIMLAVGAREHSTGPGWGGYTVDETARRHGVSVEQETTDAREAYARFPRRQPIRYREGWLPG